MIKKIIPALFVLLFFSNSLAAQKVSLQLRWDNQFQFAGYFAAEWMGYYEEIEFIVRDNGIGLSSQLDIRNVETLGLQSVVALTGYQLDGSVTIGKDNGTQFYIRFMETPGKERI